MAGTPWFAAVVVPLGALLVGIQRLELASMSSTQGLSSASHTEGINAGRIQAVLAAKSMRSSARRSASSLTTSRMPSACAATASPRSAVMWA